MVFFSLHIILGFICLTRTKKKSVIRFDLITDFEDLGSSISHHQARWSQPYDHKEEQQGKDNPYVPDEAYLSNMDRIHRKQKSLQDRIDNIEYFKGQPFCQLFFAH